MGNIQTGDIAHFSKSNPFYKPRIEKCTVCGEEYIKRGFSAKFCYICRFAKYAPNKLPNRIYEEKFGKTKQLSVATLNTNAIPAEAREVHCEWVWLLCWRILEQTKKDAYTKSKAKEKLSIKNDAIQFILSVNGKDKLWFEYLCTLLNDDMCGIRRRALKAQKEAA